MKHAGSPVLCTGWQPSLGADGWNRELSFISSPYVETAGRPVDFFFSSLYASAFHATNSRPELFRTRGIPIVHHFHTFTLSPLATTPPSVRVRRGLGFQRLISLCKGFLVRPTTVLRKVARWLRSQSMGSRKSGVSRGPSFDISHSIIVGSLCVQIGNELTPSLRESHPLSGSRFRFESFNSGPWYVSQVAIVSTR